MSPDPLLLVRLAFVAAYALIFVIDVRTRRIPNLITYPLLATALVVRPDSIGLVPLAQAIAAVVVFALFAFFALRGWMGMGDAKLAAVIALASAPLVTLTALWLAFLLGGLVGVLLLAGRRVGRSSTIPFGPYLALAGIAAAVLPDVVAGYSPFAALFG